MERLAKWIIVVGIVLMLLIPVMACKEKEKPAPVPAPIKIEEKAVVTVPPTPVEIPKKIVAVVPCVSAPKYDGKILTTKINRTALLTIRKNSAIKVRMNVGYCSYDGVPDAKGRVVISPEWTPGGKVTVGIYNSDTGTFLSSILVRGG